MSHQSPEAFRDDLFGLILEKYASNFKVLQWGLVSCQREAGNTEIIPQR